MMADNIGAIQIEVSASPDADKKMESAGKKAGQKWADSFIKSLKDKVDKSTDTRLGKTLFGTQTWNINNQPMGYQGGILSGAANSMSLKTLAILGVIAGGIGVVVGLLAKASPALSKEVGMFESAMKLFFRPFGDMLATLLRPALIWLIKMGALWNKLFGSSTNKAALTAIFDPVAFGSQMASLLTSALTNSAVWNAIKSSISGYLSDIGSVISGVWSSLVSYASTTWNNIESYMTTPIQGVLSWISNTWSGVESSLESPLINFYNWIANSWAGKLAGLSPITPPTPTPSSGGGGDSGYYDFATGRVISGATSMTQADTLASIGLPTPLSERNNQIFGGPNPFGHYAEGGIAWTPQIASVAESGPEAIIPLSKLKGGGVNISIGDINIQTMDKTQIINEVTRRISQELQRRLAVYG